MKKLDNRGIIIVSFFKLGETSLMSINLRVLLKRSKVIVSFLKVADLMSIFLTLALLRYSSSSRYFSILENRMKISLLAASIICIFFFRYYQLFYKTQIRSSPSSNEDRSAISSALIASSLAVR
ncbi:MAG: hypothetical protein ACFFD2_14555 [Promethearchaeota archaeon]